MTTRSLVPDEEEVALVEALAKINTTIHTSSPPRIRS